jgi:hypothetical protein
LRLRSRYRKDEAITAEIARAESDLRERGAEIASIKDANLRSMNDFIAAYAQVEPLEKEYDQKLQKFTELLYKDAKERDSHRPLLDVQRLRSRHHPESWEKMSQIIDLVRQINDITKREISVVHAMSSLPERFLPIRSVIAITRCYLFAPEWGQRIRHHAKSCHTRSES